MFFFFDGAIITALSLFVALVLGAYAHAHPEWALFKNEASAMSIALVLTTTLVLGCVMAPIACLEHGLRPLPWIALFIAIQIVAVLLALTVRRFLHLQPAMAT